MNGIIVINKEPDYTSNDVVAKMRGILRQKKIGHTGTLDPMATGVLPVCLGSGTGLVDMLTDKSKEYVAVMRLGVTYDTQDVTGTKLSESEVNVTEDEIRKAAEHFTGEIDQVPPMYSALKVNGQKLCDLARKGITVERKARKITIHEIEILEINLPLVKMRVACSKGTYIRTLIDDMGSFLGCGAAMESLQRTKVGQFGLDGAITLSELEKLRDEDRISEVLISVDSAFSDCQAFTVNEKGLKLLENGNPLKASEFVEPNPPKTGEIIRVYRPDNSFAAAYAYSNEKNIFMPKKMFLNQ